MALVATDGGNNQLKFDPFLIQIIRVVDSSNNQNCLEVVTPTISIDFLSKKQFSKSGTPITALGKLMQYLEASDLRQMSYLFNTDKQGCPTNSEWVQTYWELVERAILFSLVTEKDFPSDTLIIFDGRLTNKLFADEYFLKYRQGLQDSIERQKREQQRQIYLVGIAKHSAVLSRYRLAMALEGILTTDYEAYVKIPKALEERTYVRFDAYQTSGVMFLVKFGNQRRDPVWTVDLFDFQVHDAAKILGCLLKDAKEGFPVPFYPRCLQKAHENAALVEFDMDILQNLVFTGLRELLGQESPVLEAFRLQEADPIQKRYL